MLLLPLGGVHQHTSGITNTQRGVFQQSCVIKLRIIKMQSWSIDLKKRNYKDSVHNLPNILLSSNY